MSAVRGDEDSCLGGQGCLQDRCILINAAPTGEEKARHEDVMLIPGVGHFLPQIKRVAFNETLGSILEEDLAK